MFSNITEIVVTDKYFLGTWLMVFPGWPQFSRLGHWSGPAGMDWEGHSFGVRWNWSYSGFWLDEQSAWGRVPDPLRAPCCQRGCAEVWGPVPGTQVLGKEELLASVHTAVLLLCECKIHSSPSCLGVFIISVSPCRATLAKSPEMSVSHRVVILLLTWLVISPLLRDDW